ncbi:chromosome-associated kinesin KIF4A-like [Acanthaster planci]|uniref:Chromosome-associated kinesin KIF4A-like n=1 Tax=Acanthaster planci TaxID=133434 RepID=A0A8B7Y371_ACAPL|nr:chromosome-associated kinesin KIF4A-like [Acanthaster planci]XP_022086354.1 chromosome-associated kinesin KIF4A-like [Acanthaster planci]XP_022086355.1 chromosome-associated kinesin KIF4A-like [Acanthaster planci]XP_022086356.1 chromosome-associated kinesin KIF4A-like [Acanthaster planci]XP_022086357.1 chromosome-associated kinesin KIF4A-like [Acanthaster planci]
MPEEDIPVRVALRCRPLIPKEKAEGCQMCLKFIPNEPQVVLGKDKAFTYDFAFGPDTRQNTVYRSAVLPLVEGIFKGYNATVLAYGQTGSGKTYSMGSGYSMTDQETMGIIPRVIADLFSGINDRGDTEFLLKCTYLEIHKEDINDLLNTSLKKETLAVREDPEGGIRVSGLQEVIVKSASELEQCLEQGSVGRTTGSTAMNAHSSRSHAVFTVAVEMRKKDDSDNYCHAKFHLVDLAGSERAKKTQAQGERLKEGININRGLLALGNVISALGDENGRKGHIPYRDSKLTRLLQDALGGNSQTLMLACVSPADSNMEETLNTLRYADRARQIKNKPIINRDPQSAELAKLRQQVQQLQVQLLQSKSIHGGPLPDGPMEGVADLKTLLDRNHSLEAANQKLTIELQSAIEQTTQMCEKAILAEMSRDKLKQKLEQLKEETDLSLGALDLTVGAADNEKVTEQLDLVRQLQKKIIDMETEDKLSNAESLYGNEAEKENVKKEGGTCKSPNVSSPSIDFTGHTLRQAQLGRELQELNNALAMKQELAQTMGQNDEKMQVMKIHYESNVRELESEIAALQKERENLSSALYAAKSNTASNKVSEQRRVRLQELSTEISKLKKKLTEQSKLLKLKEKSDQTVQKLNKEIQSMKQARVRLMKQMKEEGDKFRQWKAEKDKEVLQLKAKDRKRQCELSKMTQRHEKQESVLRRKMEEAAAANKRLKEALEKQKAVQKKRSEEKPEEKNMVGVAKRIKSWLDHELEVMVSVNEAKRHLGSLLNDRKVLSQQLHTLQQENEEPPQKKFASPSKAVDIHNQDTGKRIKNLQDELELRNAQISDLQQKIVDADQDEKGKNRWNEITSMVEAKCGLKWLLETCVAAKVSTSEVQSQLSDLKDSHRETLAEVDRLQDEILELKASQEKQITQMQRTHEDKVLYLLTQLSQLREQTGAEAPSADGEDLQKRIKFQEDQIRELSTLHERLQETAMENEELHQQLTLVSYSGRKQSLMPTLVSPGSSPEGSPLKLPRKRPIKQRFPVERYTLEEYFESESEMDTTGNDSDWRMTPLVKRKPRESVNKKRSLDKVGCGCRGFCKSRLCSCVKGVQVCSENCRCDTAKCANRADVQRNVNDTVSTTAGNSVLMNTTVVLSDSEPESQNTTAVANPKTQAKPPRQALSELTANNTSASSSSDEFVLKPTLKRTKPPNANLHLGIARKKKVSIDAEENSGGLKRKRKLLSTSSTGSFFKPLTDS